ncbi:DUF4386 domain-containing protein [Egibacter rhizosphaerae]|uniref:DUF4386 domain-containing protein n=1 Tax=Egibacter rhizosphaerae TaxID=1670831 RepID=A0A411YB70_9ACTN|nr:DUF4386 domain-containing protein [Egibacter rhizosphaerae]QBI18503.1 DUF4386 domain-containing protein [Egibacter rhizosphaerae]
MRSASLTAGAGLLLMAALSGFGLIIVVEGLVTPGDATQTTIDILASEGLFRAGIVSVFGVIALDVVVAGALYRVFRPVSRHLSALAAGFRLAYSAVFLAAVGHLVAALRLLGSQGPLPTFSTEQVHALAMSRIGTFDAVWDAGMVLFGLHLLIVGHLVYRSGFLPRLLGLLLTVAGVGYVFDSVATVLSGGSVPEVGTYTWIGELLLAVWLVVRSRQIASNENPVRDNCPTGGHQ